MLWEVEFSRLTTGDKDASLDTILDLYIAFEFLILFPSYSANGDPSPFDDPILF